MFRYLVLAAALSIVVPAAAETRLELDDCRISGGPGFPSVKARCGKLERPLNPEAPDAGQIEISIAVVPALDLTPEPDPLVPLAGGPGQAAIQTYAGYLGAFGRVRRDRDILLVDQRGTGESARMDCDYGEASGEDLIEGPYSRAETVALTEACLAELPHDPRFFTTSVAVTDLEAVRVALGYPALNLYGASYGSRVAQHYARRYPEATRTIVLDGVVPPQLPLGPEIATEAQRAVESILSRCAEQPSCNARFPDIAADFESLKRSLEAEAVDVELADPLTGEIDVLSFGRGEFAGAIRLLAYHPNTIALMPLLISEAVEGNYTPLAAQFKMTAVTLADSLAMGMHNSVMCTEDVPYYDQAQIDYTALEASYIGPIQLEALEAICSRWPAGPIDDGFREPLATDIPVLLLSGSADPITPPRYAELAKAELERARPLIGNGQGHGQLMVGCTPRLIGEFVTSADPDAIDPECMGRSFVMPFFLGFAGPEP